jgi:hypothetical protein
VGIFHGRRYAYIPLMGIYTARWGGHDLTMKMVSIRGYRSGDSSFLLTWSGESDNPLEDGITFFEHALQVTI